MSRRLTRRQIRLGVVDPVEEPVTEKLIPQPKQPIQNALDKTFTSECEITTSHKFSDFQCPVCLETAPPPIYQCIEGHIVCSRCKPHLSGKECPSCRSSMHNGIRNRYLEEIVNGMILKCRYNKSGCKTKVPGKDLDAHEKACEYRPYECTRFNRPTNCNCGFDNCTHCRARYTKCKAALSSLDQFKKHWKEAHEQKPAIPYLKRVLANGLDDISFTCKVRLTYDGCRVREQGIDKNQHGHVIEFDGHTFCVGLFCSQVDYGVYVGSHPYLQVVPTLIGSKEEAEKYRATVRIHSVFPDNETGPPNYQKMKFENQKVHSIRSHHRRDHEFKTLDIANTITIYLNPLLEMGACYMEQLYMTDGGWTSTKVLKKDPKCMTNENDRRVLLADLKIQIMKLKA